MDIDSSDAFSSVIGVRSVRSGGASLASCSSPRLLARAAKRVGFLKLTTKRARKGYYKGKGAIGTGRFTKAGNYVVEAHKAPNFIVPNVDLASFPLKPYVASTVPKRPELVGKAPPGAAYSTLRAAR